MLLRPTSFAVVIGLLAYGQAEAQATPEETAEWNIPQWAAPTVRNILTQRGLGLFLEVNPFYLQGDFDGDGELDVAIQVKGGAGHKRGVLIIHHHTLSAFVLGAGQRFGNGGDDFSWLWQWSVNDKAALAEPRARGRHVLYVGKGDSAGGMIWWDGVRYRWTQWGD
jgi:hypothetical protein